MDATFISKALRHGYIGYERGIRQFYAHEPTRAWTEPYQPLLPSHTASPPSGRYSLSVPVRVGG